MTAGEPDAERYDFRAWTTVAIAAVMMLATLPGRTHGLGLITEPLLKSFPQITSTDYATMNLWATLLGALFCFPAGWCLDRFGVPVVTAVVVVALGSVVIAMTRTESPTTLGWQFCLSRGFGQSALSVASIALLARAFAAPNKIAPVFYTVLVGLSFGAAFKSVGALIQNFGWKVAWSGLGWGLILVVAPLTLLATPRSLSSTTATVGVSTGSTLAEALRTNIFWAFAVGISLFGLVSSGMGLFMESILKERGFSATTYYATQAKGALFGVASQLVCGALLWTVSFRAIFCVAMAGYAVALLALPFVRTEDQLFGYVAVIGVSGGALTLVFFGAWKHLFGERHVGRIVGAAQMGTVLASALGPLYFDAMNVHYKSYAQALWVVSTMAFVVVVWGALVRIPRSQWERADA